MARLRTLSIIFALLSVTALIISCGAAEEPTATAVPTTPPEPPADIEPSSDSGAPTTRAEVPRITAEELKARLDAGEKILVVDTRNEATYRYGHMLGAISIPENEVEAHFDELPRDVDIVFYCS